MNICELPIEVGVIIFNYLDTKCKINVYNSCYALRKFFAPCVARKIVLSRSTIASVKTLTQDFFQDLGQYIQELNFSGVSDLTAETLKPHIHQFKQLKTLDITFTNIYLSKLEEVCPDGLRNLSINFFKRPKTCLRNGIWDKCRNIFKEKAFHNVHFILFEFLESEMPLLFLKGLPVTNDLKMTVTDNYKEFWELEDISMNLDHAIGIDFKKLTYTFRDCSVSHKELSCLKGIANLDFSRIEYIFIAYLEKITIYASPAFKTMFSVTCSDLQVDISPYLPLDFQLDGNIIFIAWNRDTNNFDEQFLKELQKEFEDYFPTYICMHRQKRMTLTNSVESNWYCIDACDGFERSLEYLPEKVTLTDFCRKDGAVIRYHCPISLTPESKTLLNITFMRLSNICISENFFTVLYNECSKLDTLDIYVENLDLFQEYNTLLSTSIHLAKCLKNFKLTSEDIEYRKLFETLSRCPTLENIHICEYERTLDDKLNVNKLLLLIGNCVNLYSLFIEADMSPETLSSVLRPLRKKVKKIGRDHLWVEVCYRGWNPFVDVFNPSPLHILD